MATVRKHEIESFCDRYIYVFLSLLSVVSGVLFSTCNGEDFVMVTADKLSLQFLPHDALYCKACMCGTALCYALTLQSERYRQTDGLSMPLPRYALHRAVKWLNPFQQFHMHRNCLLIKLNCLRDDLCLCRRSTAMTKKLKLLHRQSMYISAYHVNVLNWHLIC